MFRVGGKIKKIRLERGIDQGQFADRVGVSQSFISQIEKGEKNPSLETLNKITKVLGVPKSVIYDENTVSINNFFEHFDEETQRFLAKENSAPYVVFAKELTEEGMTIDDIEAIKETIKNILRIKNR